MKDNINTQPIPLKKLKKIIDITMINNKYEYIVDYCHLSFNPRKYTVRLEKREDTICVFIYNSDGDIVDYCYASFNQYSNKYCLFRSPAEYSIEVLLYYNIIEDTYPTFMLTESALISLL